MIRAFICPSDGHTERIGDNVAYANYFASPGGHAAQEGGSTYTNMEPISARWGIYIAEVNYGTSPSLRAAERGLSEECPGPPSAITDGTSNTAAFAEGWRGHESGSTLPAIGDPTIVLHLQRQPR